MIVGVAVIEIHVHESQSLKAKRGIVRSILGRLRNKFNVSVGEVGGQGTWQRATIGLSMTGSDEISLRRTLRRAITFVEQTHLAEVIDSDLEIIRMPLVSDSFGEQGLPEQSEKGLSWDEDRDQRDPERRETEE